MWAAERVEASGRGEVGRGERLGRPERETNWAWVELVGFRDGVWVGFLFYFFFYS